MILPNYARNSQSGQILIIFLLILVVGLAITLSIASRTVTDVRQTTTSDESNRAYFAAEAGVENALKKIEDGSLVPSSTPDTTAGVDLTAVNRSQADVSVVSLSVDTGTAFEFPNAIAKDDVAQLSLINTFNDITTAGGAAPSILRSNGLRIYWDTGAAVEVSVITCNGATPCGASPNFNIYKWTFDGNAARAGANGFCNSAVTVNPAAILTTEGTNRQFGYSAAFNFTGAQCLNNDAFPAGSDNPVMARIRILYSGPSRVAAIPTVAGTTLPDQGSKITSIGVTPSGVTRKLTVTRLYPALPAIFDYVLYNGGNQPLSKP